ncbi:hypothetical protein AB4144_66165, partial [Rhizobiaceae sp. 2RAB30]
RRPRAIGWLEPVAAPMESAPPLQLARRRSGARVNTAEKARRSHFRAQTSQDAVTDGLAPVAGER